MNRKGDNENKKMQNRRNWKDHDPIFTHLSCILRLALYIHHHQRVCTLYIHTYIYLFIYIFIDSTKERFYYATLKPNFHTP